MAADQWLEFHNEDVLASEASAELFCPNGTWFVGARTLTSGTYTISNGTLCVRSGGQEPICRQLSLGPSGELTARDVKGVGAYVIRQASPEWRGRSAHRLCAGAN